MAKQAATPAQPKKTSCPVTKEQFRAKAPVLRVAFGVGINEDGNLDGGNIGTFLAAPKDFSTGSFGWNVNEKTTILVDGVPCKVQVGLNITVVGSKEAK